MPLAKQFLRIPLSAGLDNKTDLRSLQPAGSPSLSNCVMLKHGAVRKRHGMGSLSKTRLDGNTIAACVSGGSYKQSSFMTDFQRLWLWSDVASKWSDPTPFGYPSAQQAIYVPEATALDRIEIAGSTRQILDVDWVQAANGLIYVLQLRTDEQSGTSIEPYLAIIDGSSFGSASGIGGVSQGITAATIAQVFSADQAGTVIAPKLIVCANLVILTFIDPSGNLVAISFNAAGSDPTFPIGGGATTLIAAASLTANAKLGAYDVAPIVGDTTRFGIAVATVANGLCFRDFSTSLTLNASHNPTSVTDAQSVGLYATSGGYWWAVAGLVSAGVASLYSSFYNEAGPTLSTTNTSFASEANGVPLGKIGLAPVSGESSPSIGVIWSTGYASGSSAMRTAYARYCVLQNASSTVITAATITRVPGVQLASRPVNAPATLYNSAYVAFYTPSTLQGTVYLCELPRWAAYPASTLGATLAPARIVATLAPRLQKFVAQPMVSSGSWTLPHLLPLANVASYAANFANALGVHAFPLLFSEATFHNSCALQPVDFGVTMGRPTAELGNMLGMACGAPTMFDGQQAVELGLPTYPEFTATDVGGGGSLSAGSYQYIVTYEWYDAAGNVHRSATGPAQTITASLNDSATIVIPVLGVTRRDVITGSSTGGIRPVYAVVYRTTAGGTTFYRQTADPPPTGNALIATNLTLTITDTMSDATLTAASTAQLLYTTGGSLDNFNPPSARCIARHTQRWILSGGDNPLVVWASKALTDGECPGFNEALAFLASGAVRAIASLDDKLILFVQRGATYAIEYVTGQGPLDTGAQSDWSPPIPIPSGGAGAVDQRGTCVGPFGVLFRSPQGGPKGTGGIFLLSRDMNVTYVGGPVEDLLAASPIVTSMVVHPTNGRVYVTLITNDAAPATANNVTRIVWDYLNGGLWTIDNVWDMDAAAAGLACRTGWVAMAGGVANQPQGMTYWTASSGGRVYRESFGFGAASYLDSGSQWITMSYTSAPLKPETGFARFWRVQLEADSLETHDFTMQLLYDFAPASYYQESHTWTATQAATFDRFPQLDVEMIVGNQKAKAIQVVLTDATPTGGGVVTGQGPSWATIGVEMGTKPGRYHNIPTAQRS